MKEYTIHERTQYFPACVRTQNGAIDRWPKDVKHRLQNGIGRKSWRSLVSARRDSLRTTPCHLLSLGTKHFTNKVQVSYLSWSTRGLQKKKYSYLDLREQDSTKAARCLQSALRETGRRRAGSFSHSPLSGSPRKGKREVHVVQGKGKIKNGHEGIDKDTK